MVKVISPGFYVSIQDLGRIGYASIGVPKSGSMDLYSSKLANHLLNNDENDAVLEITFGACKLQFESDCVICITGADFSAENDHERVTLNTVLHIKKGSILSFGKRVYGVRTYVAIKKGFQTETVLESRSMFKGITQESLLQKRMVLPLIADQKIMPKNFVSVKINQNHFKSEKIACYEGPEFEQLSETQKKQLFKTKFTISIDNSRMGYKLEEPIENDFASMLTSAVLPGTVQLTPSGKLIVLMRDCQVTGGYPRVLQLTENAINKLGQKTTHDKIQFILK